MTTVELHETKHPNKHALAAFEGLVGIDAHKERLVAELALLLDPSRLERWTKKHHPRGLPIVQMVSRGAPLILLSGEVGCGKTALATSVASPLGKELDASVLCLETPSNVRGSGLVGEISNRLTTVFSMARARLAQHGHRYGLLVMDEADDLATSRAQMQAHHEDRAALNVLVKQVDLLTREAPGLAVVLITNRASVLDPAVRRRVALHLVFDRPDKAARRAIFHAILAGTTYKDADIDELVRKSEREGVAFSSSDLVHRIARLALTQARERDQPFGPAVLLTATSETEPSPPMEVIG